CEADARIRAREPAQNCRSCCPGITLISARMAGGALRPPRCRVCKKRTTEILARRTPTPARNIVALTEKHRSDSSECGSVACEEHAEYGLSCARFRSRAPQPRWELPAGPRSPRRYCAIGVHPRGSGRTQVKE